MYDVLRLSELFSHFLVTPSPPPTDIREISVLFWSGSSIVLNNKTLDKASPYSAEYPPVENVIPSNRNGLYLPRVGVLFAVGVYGVKTRMPSINICVSPASPPRTKSLPSSATVVVPGSVCNAPTKSPSALAVVTTSSGLSTDTLLLSLASNVPAESTTVSSEFTSSRNVILRSLKVVTSINDSYGSYDKNVTLSSCVPSSLVVKENDPSAAVLAPS